MSRIVLFIYIFLLYLLFRHSTYSTKKSNKLFILFTSVGLIIESGFRHVCIGPDTFNYYLRFGEVEYYSFKEILYSAFHIGHYEYIKDAGYWLIEKSFRYICPSFRLFLIFIAVIFFSSLGRFIYINIRDLRGILVSYVFYIGMFWNFFSITGCRQTIAVSIVILGVSFLEKGHWIVYAIMAILASLIHSSAIVAIIALVTVLIKPGKFYTSVIPLLIPIIFIARYSLASMILQNTNMEDRYGFYLTTTNATSSIIITLFYLIILLLCLFYRKELSSSKETYFCLKLFFIGMCFLPTMYIDTSAMRITLYFTFSMYIIVPNIVKQLRFKDNYAYAVIFMIFLSLFSIRKTWEYTFFWDYGMITEGNRSYFVRESIPYISGSAETILSID